MRLLLINPNTTVAVTERLAAEARALDPQVDVQAATARFGAPYIACEASYAVAAHAVLDAWAGAVGPVEQPGEHPADAPALSPSSPDAVLIACFGDPGLHALREVSAAPVTSLAEAAFIEAAAIGRYAVVTGGERWAPMLRRLALGLDAGQQLADIHTVAPSGIALAQDPDGATALLAEACRRAAAAPGVRAVVLGGAGLVGLAARVQPQVAVPVIDSVHAGIRHALRLAGRGPGSGSGAAQPPGRFHTRWSGLSPALQAMPGPFDMPDRSDPSGPSD